MSRAGSVLHPSSPEAAWLAQVLIVHAIGAVIFIALAGAEARRVNGFLGDLWSQDATNNAS